MSKLAFSNRENPCYDRVTKTDCPDRHGGCQVGCKRWARYVRERDREYDRRHRQNDNETDWAESRRFSKKKKGDRLHD